MRIAASVDVPEAGGPERHSLLQEARLVVEIMVARRAATRADESSLDEIRCALKQMHATSGDAFVGAYVRFHLAVARAAGPVLEALLRHLQPEIERAIADDLPPEHVVRAWRSQHTKIARSIERSDPTGCVRAMLTHLDPHHAHPAVTDLALGLYEQVTGA